MFKTTGITQIDGLNELAMRLAKGSSKGFGVLATGEQIYVALAANRPDLLKSCGYTIPQALGRIGPDWTKNLVYCWEHAGDPSR